MAPHFAALTPAPFRRAWEYLSTAKPAAPQNAEAAITPSTQTPSPPLEQDLEQPARRSLFSSKESNYMGSKKRRFELDFESPKTKRAKMEEALANSKRKRDFEFETPQKKTKTQNMSQTMPQMPRSAMKPRPLPSTPATASRKNVTFHQQPTTDTKILYPLYGPAGHYQGSVFAGKPPLSPPSPEASPSTPSTISDTSSSQLSMSPTTKSNTAANTPGAREKYCRDPHNPYWEPQPHNPRPGQFCLPEDLSVYDDEDDEDYNESLTEQTTPTQPKVNAGSTITATPETIRKGYNAVFPDSPETPRPSHAQLPATASQTTLASTSEYPTPPQYPTSTASAATNLFAGVDTDAVNKARAAAEKYKPESVGKQASKLSQVTQARSRSSSPNGSRSATPAFAIDPALVAQAQTNTGTAQQHDSDGTGEMNTHELEEQLDKWARNLEWPDSGQKIVEEELFNSDMMGHILKEWSEEDDEQSEMFWDREFDRVVGAGRRAEREGKILMFV